MRCRFRGTTNEEKYIEEEVIPNTIYDIEILPSRNTHPVPFLFDVNCSNFAGFAMSYMTAEELFDEWEILQSPSYETIQQLEDAVFNQFDKDITLVSRLGAEYCIPNIAQTGQDIVSNIRSVLSGEA